MVVVMGSLASNFTSVRMIIIVQLISYNVLHLVRQRGLYNVCI